MTNEQSPTRSPSAAQVTPPGRGAVASVRIVGAMNEIAVGIDKHFHAANRRPIAEQAVGRVYFGYWSDCESAQREDVVVCRDDDCVEIHCHGGRAAVERILRHLRSAAVPTITWQQQLTGETSSFEAECFEAMTRATTERTALILLDQASGLLEREINQLAEYSSRLAFDRNPDHEALHSRFVDRLTVLRNWTEFGRHLTEPWQVVLAGPPNAGKSTLMNALLGYSRAIVFDQPGTTRDVVTGETAFDGWPFRLSDTAGVRDTADSLEEEGIRRARIAVEQADLVCFMIDVSVSANSMNDGVLTELSRSIPDSKKLIVAHKVDLPTQMSVALPNETLRVSSVTGEGIEQLMHTLVSRLVPRVPDKQTPVPVTSRQGRLISEALRSVEADDIKSAHDFLIECLADYRPEGDER